MKKTVLKATCLTSIHGDSYFTRYVVHVMINMLFSDIPLFPYLDNSLFLCKRYCDRDQIICINLFRDNAPSLRSCDLLIIVIEIVPVRH